MTKRLLLHGLNEEQSAIALWKLLFSPHLQKHFGSAWSFEWTGKLSDHLMNGNKGAFSEQYNSLRSEVETVMSGQPNYSMANPPWSMLSLDLRVGLIPWVTPVFDRWLAALLTEGSAMEKHFGEVLPIAFFLQGGPGDSTATAFRVCAPGNAVRAAAEHWLMRAYLVRQSESYHATISDQAGRTFSVHRYVDGIGPRKGVYFETMGSFGREEDDFREFLREGHEALHSVQ